MARKPRAMHHNLWPVLSHLTRNRASLFYFISFNHRGIALQRADRWCRMPTATRELRQRRNLPGTYQSMVPPTSYPRFSPSCKQNSVQCCVAVHPPLTPPIRPQLADYNFIQPGIIIYNSLAEGKQGGTVLWAENYIGG